MLRIVNINQENISADLFGGKAHGLSLLAKCGYRIPDSIAIQATSNAHDIDDFVFRRELKERLASLNINGLYNLAVRSSCTLEDGSSDSMAGRFDTFLGEMTFDDVILNIKKVIAGLKEFPVISAAMGVIIQPLVAADYSGVLFSSDPISYKKSRSSMRNRLVTELLKIPNSRLIGDPIKRLPGIASFVFEHADGDSIVLSLDANGICVSSGSACSAGLHEPSHVLLAIGLQHKIARNSIRISLNECNTEDDVSCIIEELPPIIARLREMMPTGERG